MEIERKFIVSAAPDLPVIEHSVMYQGYISVSPVVRIRSKLKNGKETYRLCFKGKGTLCREETEMSIGKDKFDALCALIGKPLVRKEHTKYDLGNGLVLEFNSVEPEKATGFMYAEVEFGSIEEARSFVLPPYLADAREVTDDASYQMCNYWLRTRG